MRIAMIDSLMGNDVSNPQNVPYVIEVTGNAALKIYFESDSSKLECLYFESSATDSGVIDYYNEISDKETMGIVN